MKTEPSFSGLPLDETKPVTVEFSPRVVQAMLLAIDYSLQGNVLPPEEKTFLREARTRISRAVAWL